MSKVNWFPGHMRRALHQIKKQVKGIDVVIEVRDSRIPISSENVHVQEVFPTKPRLVIFNKMDLIQKQDVQRIQRKFAGQVDSTDGEQQQQQKQQQQKQQVLFCNAKQGQGTQQIPQACLQLMEASGRTVKDQVHFLITGVPNCGKSTLIRALMKTFGVDQNRKHVAVGVHPGVTRQVTPIPLTKLVQPRVFLFDTPGLMLPNITSLQVGLALGLCGCIRDKVLPVTAMASELVRILLQSPHSESLLRHHFHLPAEQEIRTVEDVLCPGGTTTVTDGAMWQFVEAFRQLKFGKIMLDTI